MNHYCYLDNGTNIEDPGDRMSLDEIKREAAIYFRDLLDKWLANPNNPNYEVEILIESEGE